MENNFKFMIEELDIRILEELLKLKSNQQERSWYFTKKILPSEKIVYDQIKMMGIIRSKLDKLKSYGYVNSEEEIINNGEKVKKLVKFFPSDKVMIKRVKFNGKKIRGILFDCGRKIFVETYKI